MVLVYCGLKVLLFLLWGGLSISEYYMMLMLTDYCVFEGYVLSLKLSWWWENLECGRIISSKLNITYNDDGFGIHFYFSTANFSAVDFFFCFCIFLLCCQETIFTL